MFRQTGDCINDMVKVGMRERKAALIHKMNDKANMNMITPFGIAGNIEKRYLVKVRNYLCKELSLDLNFFAAVLQQVNNIGSKTVVSPILSTESLEKGTEKPTI